MKDTDYYYKKCNDAVRLMSKACKELSKVEEIISDLKFYFETHHDGCWDTGLDYYLRGAESKLDIHYQSLKSILP